MKLPPYSEFPIVIGDQVSLRQIMQADLSDLIEICFYNSIQATTLLQASEMQSKIDRDYAEGNSVHWGIADNATNTLIGTCGYYRGFDNEAGELGCVLLHRYRGKGYMTAAMKLAIDFGINIMELQRIWASTTKQNDRAINLFEKLQFVKVAKLQENDIEYEFWYKN